MGKRRGAYRILVAEPDGRGLLGKPRRRWEDNIKNISLRPGMGSWVESIRFRTGTGGGLL